jgi:hypothetical protein
VSRRARKPLFRNPAKAIQASSHEIVAVLSARACDLLSRRGLTFKDDHPSKSPMVATSLTFRQRME